MSHNLILPVLTTTFGTIIVFCPFGGARSTLLLAADNAVNADAECERAAWQSGSLQLPERYQFF